MLQCKCIQPGTKAGLKLTGAERKLILDDLHCQDESYTRFPIAVVFLWVWLNPRVFPEPKSTDNWASKIVLGERVWMNRKNVPVPKHHHYLPNVLNGAGALGGLMFIAGLALLHIWLTILGGVVMFISKLWFADRMVWLYEDMEERPEYKDLAI